jgi:hypothetical protein
MNVIDLKPADTPDYMIPAWLGCLHWASQEPWVLEAFMRETGTDISTARSPLDRMIDQATGVNAHIAEAFVRWVNVEIWGPIDGPPSPAIDGAGE